MRRAVVVLASVGLLWGGELVYAGCGAVLDYSGGGGVFGVGSILNFFSSTLPPSAANDAIAMWESSCSGFAGSYFPFLSTGGSGGIPIWIFYHQGNAPAGCGEFQAYLGGDNHISEGTIQVWEKDIFGTPCNVAETLAHEIGHALGLENTNSPGGCGSIMDDPTSSGPRSVSRDDCFLAESQWQTEWELDGERLTCDSECGSTVTGSSCEIQCHGVVSPPDCGTGPAPWSPIVLDLDRNGYHLVGLEAGVSFDHNGDGVVERSGWTSGSGGDAFLHLDINGNGVVDSGQELFGNYTVLPTGGTAANGFEALAVYDHHSSGGNEDGQITAADAIWDSLRLWTDRDEDGRSSPDEITTLNSAGVLRIDLQYKSIGRRDEHGNRLRYKGSAEMRVDGREWRLNIYDVFFIGTN